MLTPPWSINIACPLIEVNIDREVQFSLMESLYLKKKSSTFQTSKLIKKRGKPKGKKYLNL